MSTIGIIGLGTIATHYYRGLSNSRFFDEIMVCDINPKAVARKLYKGSPYYQSVDALIKNGKPDYVLIATPPATHFAIAKKAIQAKINVLIEKPIFLDKKHFSIIEKLAKKHHVSVTTVFHWQNGQEVKEFLRHYRLDKISEVTTTVFDPYSKDGKTIDQDRLPLEGAFIDSGINILSFIKLFTPFKSLKINDVKFKYAKNAHLPIKAAFIGTIDRLKIKFTIDWTKHKNEKISQVKYANRLITINHSKQMIIDGKKVIKCDKMIRLDRHYYNFFTNFTGVDNYQESKVIHDYLLKINQRGSR
ncbi:MAG: Gfo/Idh/MocA family oxidoreductase [Bacilli bacterium]|nr:Gfo/Idh/MocA family oxidoreductase [Bacilli bacterium]